MVCVGVLGGVVGADGRVEWHIQDTETEDMGSTLDSTLHSQRVIGKILTTLSFTFLTCKT